MALKHRLPAIDNWNWGSTGNDRSPQGLTRAVVRQLVNSGWWPIPRVRQEASRSFDIELTNSCNTNCIFCPREKTPKQGFMDLATFKMALRRAKELGPNVEAKSCGLGEPMLHPDLVDFVRLAAAEGFAYSLTTNGSLLTREVSRQLVDAGLKTLFVSTSAVGRLYETIHRQDFALISRNVLDFVEVSRGRCRVVIAVTICDLNRGRTEELFHYWWKAEIRDFTLCQVGSRSGTVDIGLSFHRTGECRDHAVGILRKNGISNICWGPFHWYFVGWDGNYYLCSSEYRKAAPLGSVHLHSIGEINRRNIEAQVKGIEVCQKCEYHPVSLIQETLLRLKRGEATQGELNRWVWWLMRAQQNGRLLTKAQL